MAEPCSDGKDTKRGRGAKIGDGFSNFAKFLFNKETGQVMGRSGESWLKIGVFYVIFYGFLAGFFAAMLTVFLTTLNEPGKGGPKLIQFLENKPGLTLLQKLSLKYDPKDKKLVEKYSTSITKFLQNYDAPENGKEICNVTSKGMPADKPCRFNTQWLSNGCGLTNVTDNDYGLKAGVPCIYVMVNKIYGWVPTGPSGEPNYLILKCSAGATVAPKGFVISAFPFRGQKAPFQLPVVALKINVTETKEVKCWLEGTGIEVSESYVPHRAYSNIRIS